MGADIGRGVASSYNSMGQSLASGQLGSAGAWNSGITNVTNALGQGLGAYQTYLGSQTPKTNLGTK
jgi:hypothetical protein